MGLPGLPKGLDNIGADLAEFKSTMARVEMGTEDAANAAVAALIGEHGLEGASELLRQAIELRAQLAADDDPMARLG
ncbi:hypothetical protein I5G62_gp81 [Mycobacterium phage CRB2]|uniref:Uncharacterized protein n=1 Tax=Mycobacterium phage CRB2 TaxID=2483623 RepID=A0A455LM89_9CAUD|nr:hypothetical protein I5G62_gp81 [Mycobacterium phage CRB2]AYP70067.1 hypothetical protein CRB2_81 [Mycobacterium phage CRB2]